MPTEPAIATNADPAAIAPRVASAAHAAAPDEIATTCPYCGVGCGVLVRREGQGAEARIVSVRGDPAHPANAGRLCTKGSTLHRVSEPQRQRQARLLSPMRRDGRDDAFTAVGWTEVASELVTRLADIRERHGPAAIAFYLSGQLLTEDYAAFNKLARGLIGTPHVDSNSRLCMSSAVTGYRQTLGADAPPACYADIDQADCLFITGSNTAWAHPIVFRRIEAARAARPAMRMIVVDPRRTETAAAADLHLPILPGTDVALYHAMLHWMVWEERIDRDFITRHTLGFEALRARVRECSPRWAAGVCGVREADIVQAADWFSASPATLSMWCQGLNQSAHGTASNAALINLHLATAQIGRPGAGPLSLTGQPNAMGGREVGAMATILPGHRDPADAADRAEVAQAWGIDALPQGPGLTAVPMIEAIERGEIRAIWIVCTNPLQSLPDLGRLRAALDQADLVIVQDAFDATATATAADILLPATTWGEKSGTVTNSERRISRVRAVLPAPGLARDDWRIAAEFGQAFAAELVRRGEAPRARFDWPDAEAVWNEHRDLTRGRDLDIGGLSWARLEADGPQQWPMPAGAAEGQARLYTDHRFPTPDGRARFVDADPAKTVAERVDATFPLALTTGRLRDQWHGMSRTGLVGSLFGHEPEPMLSMAADDLVRRGLKPGQLVRIDSRRGSLVLPVQASDTLRSGMAWVPMHWGPEFVAGRDERGPRHGVNGLTVAALDPHSKQPELKHAAVRVTDAGLAHRLVAFGLLPAGEIIGRRRAIAAWMRQFDHASCVPFAHAGVEGLRLRIASRAPLEAALQSAIAAHFGAADDRLLRYGDARRGIARQALVEGGRLQYVLLAGDEASAHWLADWMDGERLVTGLGPRLLSGAATAPDGAAPRGRIVCNCLGVPDSRIRAVLAEPMPSASADGHLARLQTRLGCGTQCGSCLPELRRAIAAGSSSETTTALAASQR